MKNRITRIFAVLSLSLALGGNALAGDIVLTPFGQSPDAMMVKVVLKKLGQDARLEKMLEADGLQGEKALIIVVAGSSKGLGEAGIDKDAEIARVQGVADAAEAAGVKTLVMHIGGKGRRGTLTDLFIEESVPMADAVIVVEGGDYDGLFTELCAESEVELIPAPSVRETTEPLQAVLVEWGVL
jgi:hypothetical protein